MFSNFVLVSFNIAFIDLSYSNSNSIMAQLPPKIPSMAQNWPTSPHQKMTNTTLPNFITNSSHRQQQQCNNNNWMEELFDFTSSSRRVGHKRSMSDSDALFESPLSHNNGTTFDRFDDEQLMSMFSSDDMSITVPPTTVSSSNPSSPSDQNSNNDDIPMLLELDQLNNNNNNNNNCQMLKVEPGEIESSFDSDQQPQVQPSPTNSSPNLSTYADPINIDPKRVKRILANRQSAQRSRVRKLQYISELERSVTALQSEVSALSPRVAFLDHQRLVLNVDNSTLKQRIAALAQDKIFKDAHQEALKKEIERLRQIYHQQNLKKMTNQNAQTPPSLSHQQSPNSDTMVCTDNK